MTSGLRCSMRAHGKQDWQDAGLPIEGADGQLAA